MINYFGATVLLRFKLTQFLFFLNRADLLFKLSLVAKKGSRPVIILPQQSFYRVELSLTTKRMKREVVCGFSPHHLSGSVETLGVNGLNKWWRGKSWRKKQHTMRSSREAKTSRSSLCGWDIWVNALGIVHVATSIRAYKPWAAWAEDVNVWHS